MKKILTYLNPINHLGDKDYSIWFPLISMLAITAFSEIYAYVIIENPMAVGIYAIFLYVSLIIYFAFRNGMSGGFVATIVTIAYYFYIIYTRHYTGQQLNSGLETTLTLGIVYVLLGGIIGWLKQTIDDLLEHETVQRRRMEAIIEQLPVGVLITDNHGMLVQRNKKLDQILGLKIPVGFKIGEDNLQNVKIDGKVINPKQSVLSHALQNGRVVGKEYAYERPDGKHVSLTVSSSVIRRQDGEIIAAASIVNDITAQKEMEARKDDFVNMASHELKTPITSLKIYIGYLIKKVGATNETNILKTLRSIQYQTEKLQEIVNSLLDVSRLQTGKLTFNKEKFDICELLQETVESLQGATNKQRLVYESHKPLIVFADKFRTYQVITNLITNAIKYSKQATDIKIKVKKSGGKAQVSVKDYGIGIEEGQHKKIFDKLYQVTTDTEKTFPGFGMGLYISREIIKRHRGSIWVESEKGKGSTFHFTLPLA